MGDMKPLRQRLMKYHCHLFERTDLYTTGTAIDKHALIYAMEALLLPSGRGLQYSSALHHFLAASFPRPVQGQQGAQRFHDVLRSWQDGNSSTAQDTQKGEHKRGPVKS